MKKTLRPFHKREWAIESLIHILALMSLVVLFFIAFFLFKEAFYIFYKEGVRKVIFGTMWYPTHEPPSFGMLPLIVGTLSVAFLTAFIAVPIGIATAIYLSEIASIRTREFLKPIIEMLSSFPTVILGFLGLVVVAPFLAGEVSTFFSEKIPEVLRSFDVPFISDTLSKFFFENMFIETGLNMFCASLMLTVVAIPIIASVAEDALSRVPNHYREASFAIGATKWITVKKVVIPLAFSGLVVAVMLGFVRVIGETMIVLMVAGGAASFPNSIFDPVRPMPTSIVAEMGHMNFDKLHYHALFGVAALLFIFTFMLSLISNIILKNSRVINEKQYYDKREK